MSKKRKITHISVYTETVIPVQRTATAYSIVYNLKADSHFYCTITMKPGLQKSTKMQIAGFINKAKNDTKGLLVCLNKFK